MNCPLCNSENRQSFWFWEKEDILLREWAMDTRLHFSICRDCSTIFHDSSVERSEMDDFGFGDIEETGDDGFSEEPMIWLKQFTPSANQKGRVLEVFHKKPKFVERLKNEEWADVKAVSMAQLLDGDKSPDAGFEELAPSVDEQFDLVICFDALNQTNQPMDALNKIHGKVLDGGGIYLEVGNPMALPRFEKMHLTSDEICVFPFHSIIYGMHKAGFTNAGAEMWGKIRCYGAKTEPDHMAEPTQSIPRHIWEFSSYRFQRNYYWAWCNQYLRKYLQHQQNDPTYLNQIREELQSDVLNRQIIRDVCGGCLLFAQEINDLRSKLGADPNDPDDWKSVLSRIFEIFKHDIALYDMFQIGGIEGLGEFANIGRFHYNEKMIYMTNFDYFEKYFSEEEARRLCDSIIQSGHIVCGNLSSFL